MRIYIDTSVINGLYINDAVWMKEAKTRIGVNSINEKNGYIQIDICSPEEVS